ncbi:ThiF family adenylyltransferase [Roseiconus lacunae]|uniref:ThiF family adenylyltransferase n=1 Tax=Roseiconus lacunae TaxID=2605694 RepID=UPI001E62CD82|nr:ThiF family adenylyltransferase [Roseiconus lacunae]MCD0462499.1 ThiF family adenylyltransferase [Roseiconus lacunae]
MNASLDRFSRQAGIVPVDRLGSVNATVIGVGAIGRQVAIQLAAIGIKKIQLIDFDEVDLSNTTTQGYPHREIGVAKTHACANAIAELDPTIDITLLQDRFRPRHDVGNAVFCCVDCISARSAIWNSLEGKVEFWADGRMLGEVIRVIAVAGHDGSLYRSTLFSPSEAQPGTCTSRSTIYAASIAAALMVHQFTRWLRDISVDCETSLNLLSGEWLVNESG